ncbi:hypothetical protein KSS87_016758, partial [Heliosperma pusillum]
MNCSLRYSSACQQKLCYDLSLSANYVLHLTDFDTFGNILELDYPLKDPVHGGVNVAG